MSHALQWRSPTSPVGPRDFLWRSGTSLALNGIKAGRQYAWIDIAREAMTMGLENKQRRRKRRHAVGTQQPSEVVAVQVGCAWLNRLEVYNGMLLLLCSAIPMKFFYLRGALQQIQTYKMHRWICPRIRPQQQINSTLAGEPCLPTFLTSWTRKRPQIPLALW